MESDSNKLIKLLIMLTLIAGFQGYAITSASADNCGDQPTSASQPCHAICGDHPCAPGEVYTPKAYPPVTPNSTSSSTTPTPTPAMTNATSENMTMSNATATSTPPTTPTPTPAMTNATSENMTSTTPPKMLSPKAQVASGVAPSQVKCSEGHSLVINSFNSRPACIKSEDFAKFIARGWGQPAA